MGKQKSAELISSQPTSRFLQACNKLPVDMVPIWLMRQAGRYMAEYRELRSRYSMLELIRTPELAAEVTMQPINAFDLDAAIIFADILPPLTGMGLELEFIEGKGPVFHDPIQTTYDIDMLKTPPAVEVLASTLEAIKIVVNKLAPRNIPLIGFAGAPFTLASYAIEGGGSKNFLKTKRLMYSEPAAWDRLMNKLVTVQLDYLLEQAKAGASALQVFDSWVGQALSKSDYIRYVKPYNTKLFSALEQAGVPIINYSNGTYGYIDQVLSCGGDVIGVDWRMSMADYQARIGDKFALMGNLDPTSLLAPWRELKPHIDEILGAVGDINGFIFNLGHGILPPTPVENVRRLVDYVHEETRR
jgi:uroporphyrinogen decarboxylase